MARRQAHDMDARRARRYHSRMISLRTLSVSAAIAAVLPLQALAAFASPGALVAAWMDDRSARDFAFEAHAQVEEYYFSLWAKGSYQGAWPQDGSAVETITFDMAAPTEGVTARVKAEVLLKDNVLYAKLVTAEGMVSQEVTDLSASLKMKKWIAIPLDESMMLAAQEMGMGMEEQKMLVSAVYDAIFTMNAKPTSWGTEYQLMLKRDFLQQMLAALAEVDPYLMPMEVAEVRDMERMILRHLKLDMKLNVDKNDLSLGATVNGTFNMPEENVSARFMLDTNRRKAPLVVEAPAGAVSIEEFMNSVSGTDLSNLDSFVPPMIPFGGNNHDVWMPEEEGMEEEWTESDYDWSTPASDCTVNELRKGLCGNQRPLRNR
jgi:hypothetical protein